jgi:hypothetical protein
MAKCAPTDRVTSSGVVGPRNDQRFRRESADVPPDLLIRPRAFVGRKRLSGRLFAGLGAESALIVA